MADGGHRQILPSGPDEMEMMQVHDEILANRPVQYVLVKKQNITYRTNIAGSNIENFGPSQNNAGSSPMSGTAEKKKQNQGMTGDENPQDCTWLSPKVAIFHKRCVSRKPSSNVYHGRQEILNGRCRDVAIKLIKYSEKNMKEIETLLKLNHPNIAQIHDAGDYRGACHWIYIVMKLCSMNLEEYVCKNPSDPPKAFVFFNQIVAAVTYMHDRNIAHRDIKPTNILISLCGNVIKLSDFGISKEIPYGHTSVTSSSQGAGSEGYKPPEAYNAKNKVTLKSDIFSLGLVTMYLFSHGRHPFGDDPFDWSYKIRKNMNFDLSNIPPGTQRRQEIICLIDKMLHHEPRDRPTIYQIKEEASFTERLDEQIDNISSITDYSDMCPSDIETRQKCLNKLKATGLIGKPTIVLFHATTKHLYHFDHNNKSMAEMHKYPPDSWTSFAAATLEGYIYVFKDNGSVYRLKHSDPKATWERLKDCIEYHGGPVIASSNTIFHVGGASGKAKKSVLKYNTALDEWEKLTDKPTAIGGSGLLCNHEFLYCIGGSDGSDHPTNIVEKMEMTTMIWHAVANTTQCLYNPSAATCLQSIYVADKIGGKLHMEMYDPNVNQWTEMKSFDISRGRIFKRSCRKLFSIDGTLYLVMAKFLATYDIVESEWNVISCRDYKHVDEAVLINT